MKIIQDSIFISALRAFLVSFFAVIGVAIAFTAIILGIYGLESLSKEETFSSSVKILPDSQGSRKELGGNTPVILQISLKGEIGKDEITASKIENVLLKSRESEFKNDRVKGILLVIDSPGGGANESDHIHRLIQEYKSRYNVPVYAYVDGLCASGGYLIACAADKIYASGSSVVGSVGVLSWPPFYNVTDLLKKVGVDALTLYAGQGKDEMNPFRPWKEDEQKNYQQLIDFYYDRFTSLVLAARPSLQKDKLLETLGARVFPAPLALDHGYIDAASSSRAEVLDALSEASSIKDKYQVVTIESKEWLKKLLQEKSPLITGRIEHTLAPQPHFSVDYRYAP